MTAVTPSTEATEPVRLSVVVLTFKRPDELAKALPEILLHVDEVNRTHDELSAEVVVIDNDPAGSAEQTIAEIGHGALRYVLEAHPGIAAARNRGLDEAAASDLLVFIDDDEVPRAKWLSSLLDTWTQTRAAAVMGRVESVFGDDVPQWILSGDFWARPRMPSGTEIPVAAAGNLLLDLRQIRALGVRFDTGLGLSGGEDTLFSRTLTSRGGRIVWCDESAADDLVPPQRLTRSWLTRRAWSQGNTTIVVELRMAPSAAKRLTVRASAIAHGLARVGVGAARFGLGVVSRSEANRGQGLRVVYRGGGMIAAALNIVYREYARTEPDTH